MRYAHILIEAYCSYKHRVEKMTKAPNYCKNGINKPGYHCFDNECPFISYTQYPYEFAYAGKYGEIKDNDSYIGFGGEMECNNYDETERTKITNFMGKNL